MLHERVRFAAGPFSGFFRTPVHCHARRLPAASAWTYTGGRPPHLAVAIPHDHAEPQPAVPPPSPRFQFTLRTLLLLFVVLGSSLAVFGAWGIVVFGLVVGLAIYVREIKSLLSLVYLALVVLFLMCLFPLFNSPRSPTRRTSTCSNTLKQVALALLNFHAVNGCFPPAYIADKNGKPMHSWRKESCREG